MGVILDKLLATNLRPRHAKLVSRALGGGFAAVGVASFIHDPGSNVGFVFGFAGSVLALDEVYSTGIDVAEAVDPTPSERHLEELRERGVLPKVEGAEEAARRAKAYAMGKVVISDVSPDSFPSFAQGMRSLSRMVSPDPAGESDSYVAGLETADEMKNVCNMEDLAISLAADHIESLSLPALGGAPVPMNSESAYDRERVVLQIEGSGRDRGGRLREALAGWDAEVDRILMRVDECGPHDLALVAEGNGFVAGHSAGILTVSGRSDAVEVARCLSEAHGGWEEIRHCWSDLADPAATPDLALDRSFAEVRAAFGDAVYGDTEGGGPEVGRESVRMDGSVGAVLDATQSAPANLEKLRARTRAAAQRESPAGDREGRLRSGGGYVNDQVPAQALDARRDNLNERAALPASVVQGLEQASLNLQRDLGNAAEAARAMRARLHLTPAARDALAAAGHARPAGGGATRASDAGRAAAVDRNAHFPRRPLGPRRT